MFMFGVKKLVRNNRKKFLLVDGLGFCVWNELGLDEIFFIFWGLWMYDLWVIIR